MKKHFVLFAAVAFAMSAMAATVQVTPGDGTLKTAVSNAASGDVLELSTGTYGISSNIDLTTENQVLTIKAAAGAKPVINITNGSIRLKATGVQFTIEGASLEGSSSIRAILVNAGIENTSLTVNNCIFKNLQRAIYVVDARKTCKDVHISNSSFLHVGDADNRTVYFAPVEGEDDIQYDVTCEIDHCTFYDCNNTRTVYCPAYNGSHVTNCLACNTELISGYNAYAVYGKNSYVHNSLAFKTGIKTSSSATQSNCIFQDPLFVDATNDNLQLYKNSPAVGAATDGSNLGDPRWGVSDEEYDISNTPIADRIYKNPYSMAPTTSSIRILWQQSDSLSLGRVAYGLDEQNLNDTVSSRGGWMVDGEGYVHVVELTGLQPFTRYYFKVGDKKSFYDYTASTKTAPEAGVAYRIFTISDIHVNSRKNWENMQDDVLGLNADLMMCNGDFVNDGSGRDWNEALFTPGKKVLASLPLMSSTGNHETGDPTTYCWRTMFDYFSQFSHGEAEDPIADPRGEGYYGYDYGNARILAISVSEYLSAPKFDPESDQFKWVENELKNATKDWILIFGHVGLTTSGYHGQWPPSHRDEWRALFEKYAKQGKKIIYFCGDDHSFEHAYKDGVHYVRPGCGRNSNYAQCNTKDIQYSMYYKQISCYSTLDMAADGSSLHLTARDSAANVFYEYDFLKNGEEIVPAVKFTAPTAEVETGDSIQLKWVVFDPFGDAKLSLYYSQTPDLTSAEGLTPIIKDVDNKTKKIFWNTRDIYPKGKYYLYASLTAGGQTYWTPKAEAVVLVEDTVAPPAPRNFWGFSHGDNYRLVWDNPTHKVSTEQILQTFDEGLAHMEEDSEEGCSSTMTNPSKVLKVAYSTAGDWSQTSVDYVFDEATNCKETSTLSFRLKGDGSGTALRIICKNMVDDHEDWWYTEEVNLSSSSWKSKEVDLTTLKAFDWYTNTDTKNRCDGIVRICFAITTSEAATGSYCIEDLKMTGLTLPSTDYKTTIIRRSEKDYPTTTTGGVFVYYGTDESCIDQFASTSKKYYYSAFSVDDRGNVSEPAHWLSTDLHDALPSVQADGNGASKIMVDGQLLILNNGTVYSAQGQTLK